MCIRDRHTIIPLYTPQGELEIKMNSKTKYQYIIRPAGVDTTLNVQTINETEQYITGKYDVELLTLPRKKFYDIEINQNSKTTYTIPAPSIANIILPSRGYGGVYLKNGDKFEQIYHFKGEKTQHKLTLLSGNYKVVFRAIAAKEYIYTKEKDFKLKSSESKIIKFY